MIPKCKNCGKNNGNCCASCDTPLCQKCYCSFSPVIEPCTIYLCKGCYNSSIDLMQEMRQIEEKYIDLFNKWREQLNISMYIR